MEAQFRFVRFCVLTLISLACFSSAASNGDVFSWETVQLNMRMTNGDYQIETPNEGRCKTRCVETSDCIGVDWHDGYTSCFLFYDSNVSPHSANGFSHWRLTRNKSTNTIINQASPSTPAPVGIDVSARVDPVAEKHVTTQEPNKEKIEGHADTGGTYAWQPVQLNMRVKVGEFRQDLQNETACKDYCLQTSSCAGVFWHNHNNGGICILHTDCSATLYHENGFRYWSIKKYIPAPSTCRDLIRRVSVDEVSAKCESQNSTTAANALGVLLSFSTAIIIALILNTFRLNRRIKKLAFPRMDVQFVQQVLEQQQQEHETIVRPICSNQSSVYMEMVGSTNDIANVYDDLNDLPVQYTTIIL